jgi:4-amino-4-deoxy-L-arabinose transferase-like glycosyltransferase
MPESASGNALGSWVGKRRDAVIAVAIFASAFALRYLYTLQLHADPIRDRARNPLMDWTIFDSFYYHVSARDISHGILEAKTAFFLGPLYSYVMGGVYTVFGVNLEWVRILQCALGAGSCVLLYWLGRRFFSPAVGIIAASIFSIYGLHIFYSGVILPTVLVTFLNLLFLWLIAGAQEELPPIRVGLAGAVLGLAILAKSNALLLLPMSLLAIFLLRSQWPPKIATRAAIILTVATIVIIAPATWHNYRVTGEFVLVTTTTGRNLLKGNGPNANGTHVQIEKGQGTGLFIHLLREVEPKQAVEESHEMSREAREYMLEHPIDTVKLLIKKGFLFLNHRELFIRDNAYFAKRYSSLLRLPLPNFSLVASLGLAGALLGWRRWRHNAFLYGVLLTQVASFVIVFVIARYRMVAVACLILFASQFLVEAAGQIRARKRQALVLAAAVLLASTAVVHIPFSEFPYNRGFEEKRKKVVKRNRIIRAEKEKAKANQAPLDAPSEPAPTGVE